MEKTKTLIIYDLDDTLFFANTAIKAIDKDGQIEYVTHQAHDIERAAGTTRIFDYSELACMVKFKESLAPNWFVIAQCLYDVATKGHVLFMTARHGVTDKQALYDIMNSYGMSVNDDNFIFASAHNPGGKSHLNKLVFFHRFCTSGYNDIIMYDDSIVNLDAFVQYSKEYPTIDFTFNHVLKDGTFVNYITGE